jgi:hypothetical protein
VRGTLFDPAFGGLSGRYPTGQRIHYMKCVGALERGLAQLSRCNSGWFCHTGQLGSGTWPAKAAGAAQRETERGGLEVDEGGPSCNSPEVQGLHCKAKLTFKP